MPVACRIVVQPLRPTAHLRREWQALQARADASPFQTAEWALCLAEQRLPDAVLLRAERGGELVGLAVAGRRNGALHLTETGRPEADAVYVEHNAPLLARGHESLMGACLAALLRAGGRRGLVLSGIGPATAAALPPGTVCRVAGEKGAPFIALDAIAAGPDGYIATLSANTRQQLRRSNRGYERSGPIVARRPDGVAEALGFLDELAHLHQAAWTGRGRPGAFANPEFAAFHRALVAAAWSSGLADLLRISAGPRHIGTLYNLRHGGLVCSYQCGFDYDGAIGPEKPGLTCHHAAIELARAEGLRIYDFLAGEDRYKTSLANRSARMTWLRAAPRISLAGASLLARGLFSRA